MVHWKHPHHAGFTLMEVLIAVVTFAIVLGAINSVFYGALRLRNKTTESIERALPIQQATAIIKRDLAGIVAPGGTLAGAFKSDASSSGTMSAIGGSRQQSSPEIFTNTGVIDTALPWSEVQKVVYYLRQPTNRFTAKGNDLVRSVTRNLLSMTQDEPVEQFLMGDVERLDFSYYSGTEWRDSWDSASEETVLPKAIKVQIQLAAEDSRSDLLPPVELIVPIVVQAVTNQTQTAGGGQ